MMDDDDDDVMHFFRLLGGKTWLPGATPLPCSTHEVVKPIKIEQFTTQMLVSSVQFSSPWKRECRNQKGEIWCGRSSSMVLVGTSCGRPDIDTSTHGLSTMSEHLLLVRRAYLQQLHRKTKQLYLTVFCWCHPFIPTAIPMSWELLIFFLHTITLCLFVRPSKATLGVGYYGMWLMF